MNKTPIELTLYDENDEEINTYRRLIVPWGMLKRAMKFRGIDEKNVDEKTFDELASYVCEFFNNKVTIDEINKYADTSDMLTVISTIVSRAGAYFNPNVQTGK